MSKFVGSLYMSIFSRKLFSPAVCNNCHVRFLYSEAVLGLDNYVKTRERVQSQFDNMLDKFKSKMSEYAQPKSTNMIFTEDLKNMLYIVESKESDIQLVIDMMKRFNQQNSSLRFGNFIFGPVVMRMFYYLQRPEDALKCFKDPELNGFFDQLVTYQILMDLLYLHEKYSDVIDVYEIIKTKQIQNAKYPKNVIVLTFAACYKQNTKESLDYALNLYKELQAVGHRPMRKGITFLAALAINQGNPRASLEILSSLKQQTYMTVRNIKVAALAAIGRPDDAIPILKGVLDIDVPTQKKSTFNPEVLKSLHDSIHKTENKELILEFTKIEKILRNEGHVSDTSLDNDLCAEVHSVNNPQQQERFNYNRNNYERRNYNENHNRRPFQRRPGLKDLY